MTVPCPREGGLQRGEIFWLHLTTASAQCLRLSFSFTLFFPVFCLYCSDPVVSTGATDQLEKLVSEMTFTVLTETFTYHHIVHGQIVMMHTIIHRLALMCDCFFLPACRRPQGLVVIGVSVCLSVRTVFVRKISQEPVHGSPPNLVGGSRG